MVDADSGQVGWGRKLSAAWKRATRHLRHAFAWNLQTIAVTDREQRSLNATGIADPTLQRYAAWRRSILFLVFLPTLLSALLATLDNFVEEAQGLSRLGKALLVINTLVLWAMPLTALLAFRCWTSLRRSHHLLVFGWAVAFLPPFGLALIPMAWWFAPATSPEELAGQQVELAVLDVINGLYLAFTLLPAALSVLPGLIRACLRVKSLLPASIVSGWFLVAGAPFYLLLWLVALVALNHLAGSPLLILGVLLWIGAPLGYVWRSDLFIRPVSASACRAIGRTQWLVGGVSALGWLLLLAYLFTKQVFGLELVGLDPETSLVWLWHNEPEELGRDTVAHATSWFWLGDWDLAQLVLEYASRSLFLTAVFADLLVRMNLSVWQQEKQIADTAEASEYNATMTGLARFFGNQSANRTA